MSALGLNHAVLNTVDLDRQVAYYTDLVGLCLVERGSDHAYLATRSGADALLLRRGQATALTGLALLTHVDKSGEEIRRQLADDGIAAEIRHDPHPGVASSVVFIDLDGFEIELISDRRIHPASPSHGVAPLRIGHVARCVPDVARTCEFYGSVLGLKVADRIGEHFVFMRTGVEHHTLNFIQSDRSRLHHIAFEMQDSATLTSACDVLAQAERKVIWGPVRHGPGHNIATYHINPEGQMIEFYAEMDRMTNEALGYYDPRPWHGDRPQRPKTWPAGQDIGIWGPGPPEGFLKQGV
ncbi:catechol-2,3-dioxygenase [Rhizobium sp. WW_1]|nr:catechol-2,3-dioxygenase [Rhizobium sp. WW_1]